MSESDAYCLMRQHEEIDKLQARVAGLESENAQHLEQINRLHADIIRLRGWTANAGLPPIDETRHAPEVVADLQRRALISANASGPLTPAEGVFDNAGGAPGSAPRSPTSELLEPPSSRRGEPAPDLPDVFTQAVATLGPLTAIAKEVSDDPARIDAQPRPAHPEHLSKGPTVADPWKHGAECMRHAILQLLPGGQICDPQQIANMIRNIEVPALDSAAPPQSPAGADRVDLVAQTMMRGMFAEHELPLSPLLQSRYRLVAVDIVAALDSAAPR